MFFIDVEDFAFVEIQSECSLSDFRDKPNHVYYFCVPSLCSFLGDKWLKWDNQRKISC